MNSEKQARVLLEPEGEKEEGRGKKEKGDEVDEDEDEEEEGEEEEQEEEEEEEDEEEEDEEEDEDEEKVVEDDCNKIPPEVCSSNCHIHKLNSCEKKGIKLLCYYFEKCSDATKKCSIESDISNSKYCETFNKIIDVYNNETKCKDGNSDNEYCQEVKHLKQTYRKRKLTNFTCVEPQLSPHSQKPEIQCNELHVDLSDARPLERGTGNDSTICEMQWTLIRDSQDVEPKSLDKFPNSEELVSTVIPKDGIVNEKQHGGRDAQITQHNQVQSQTLSLSYMDESHKMVSTPLTSCPHGSNKEPCENSLQLPVVINGEKTYQLDQTIHENTEDKVNSHRNSQGTSNNSITIISASSVLGIPLLLFMLYKFTPLASMVNKRKRKKDKWKTNEERYDQHLLHNKELRNINSNIIKYNIAYYSLVNS